MKKFTFLLALGMLLLQSNLFAQRTCHAHEQLMQEIQENPQRLIQMEQLEEFTQRFIRSSEMNQRAVIQIPVIVHVVYNGSTQNISDAQINSQITVLNDDFRRQNSDAGNTPSDFVGVAADTEIEFCLDRVTRTPTTRTSWGTNNAVKDPNQGGVAVISPESYLNVWVCVIGGGILGYAQFPGGSAATDGVVCDYRYFGTIGTATAPFDLGRTMTHEVGHYLNLRHIWGDGGCSVDDFVSDTPEAGGPNFTGSPCSYPGPNSCVPRGRNRNDPDFPDMFQNYMDYSDDVCMNLFTEGQKTRMLAALAGSRPDLGSITCGGTPPPPSEICDNGQDDDGDGLTDCDDPDCVSATNCQGPDVCDAPVLIGSSPVGNTRKPNVKARLSWNTAVGANTYTVEWKLSSATTYSNNTTTTSNSVTVSNLDNGSSYDWQVTSNCNNDNVTSTEASFIAGQSSGARTKQNISKLPVYPNPAQSTVLVDLSKIFAQEDQVLQLMDIMGRSLQELRIDAEMQMVELQLNDLPNGLYLIRISDRNGVINASSKLLIQH